MSHMDGPDYERGLDETEADEYDDHDGEYDDPADDGEYHPTPRGGRRAERPRRRVPGCLVFLIVVAVIAAGGYVAVKAIDVHPLESLKDKLGLVDAADYPGPGSGKVNFEVMKGDTSTDIGRGLKDAGIVASVDAFVSAANGNPESASIQVGTYPMLKKMSAQDALAVLIDPKNMVTDMVTIPEGLQLTEIVDVLAAKTDFKKKQFEKVLAAPDALGLPADADGNAEGYLFPATYSFGPDDKPVDMLKAMVDRWKQSADEAGLDAAAERLGYSPHELMTIASLIQAEGRGDYMPKISRVIYNRLDTPGYPTFGLLQVDATVNYALGRPGIAALTQDEIDSVADSPYNTYKQEGLPPGPIEAPGDDAIAAAAKPAKGNWLFYVTVNLKTGETKFTADYDEFLQYKQEFKDYCATQSDRC